RRCGRGRDQEPEDRQGRDAEESRAGLLRREGPVGPSARHGDASIATEMRFAPGGIDLRTMNARKDAARCGECSPGSVGSVSAVRTVAAVRAVAPMAAVAAVTPVAAVAAVRTVAAVRRVGEMLGEENVLAVRLGAERLRRV